MSVKELIQQWDIANGLSLTETEAKELLREAGISVTEVVLAHSAEDAAAAGASVGFPVVIKVASRPRILHPLAGVASQPLSSEAEVKRAYEEVISNARRWDPSATIDGITVQRVMRPAVELRMVVEQHPLFGSVVSFSYGRMALDVWEDASYRAIPLIAKDARLMIREPKGHRLLQGYGALEAPDTSLIEQTLLKVSELVTNVPELHELELDPVYAYRDSIAVVDARVELRRPGAQ